MKVCRRITALVALLPGLCPLLDAAPAPELALLQRLYAGQLAEKNSQVPGYSSVF